MSPSPKAQSRPRWLLPYRTSWIRGSRNGARAMTLNPAVGRTWGRPATTVVNSAMWTRSACGRSPRTRAWPLPSGQRMKSRPAVPVTEPTLIGAPVAVESFVGAGYVTTAPFRPSDPPVRRTTTVHAPLAAAGSLRVRNASPGCPLSAKAPIADRAVSTRRGLVVESVGVGSLRLVASADGVRDGGRAELPPRLFAATASPSARASTTTKTKPRGAPAAREPSGSTPAFQRMSQASHRRRRPPPPWYTPDLGTLARRQK